MTKNPQACLIFQSASTRRNLDAEGTCRDNLITTIHIASTEAQASHDSKQYSIPFVVDRLLLGFAFLFWFSWQCI